jgi:hypothetical protein
MTKKTLEVLPGIPKMEKKRERQMKAKRREEAGGEEGSQSLAGSLHFPSLSFLLPVCLVPVLQDFRALLEFPYWIVPCWGRDGQELQLKCLISPL